MTLIESFKWELSDFFFFLWIILIKYLISLNVGICWWGNCGIAESWAHLGGGGLWWLMFPSTANERIWIRFKMAPVAIVLLVTMMDVHRLLFLLILLLSLSSLLSFLLLFLIFIRDFRIFFKISFDFLCLNRLINWLNRFQSTKATFFYFLLHS